MPATRRGVRNAETAVPTMPAPKTPVAKPLRFDSYQAEQNGTPMANTVPAMPRKKATTTSSPKLPSCPTNPVSSTSGAVTPRITVNISRPP